MKMADTGFRELVIPQSGLELAARLFTPQGRPQRAAVISHGLFSSMESAKLNRLARALAASGSLTLLFDHSGCGMSPGDVSDTTLTSRRDEFLAGVELLAAHAPGLPMVYLGSSLGGLAILAAADIKTPACLVCWSTPVDPLALPLGNPREDLPLMARDLSGYDLSGLAARAGCVLFVHGERDEVVPVEQARAGHRLCREPKDLLILPQGDHRISDVELQGQAIARTLEWVEKYA